MGFHEPNCADNNDAGAAGVGGGGGGESPNSSTESCSICLEHVVGDGRTCVKLVCGHEFHLDCIGSAFNSRGAMQCPNCRNTEKGQWRYASGNAIPPIDHSRDEEFYDLSYSDASELPLGGRWYQLMFSQLASAFEDGEIGSVPYNDLLAQYALLAEHATATPATQTPPYFSYYGPTRPTIPDNSYNNHWSTSLSGLNEATPTSFGFQSVDPHYNTWDHHSSSHLPALGNRLGNADHPSPPNMIPRSNPSLTRPSFPMHHFAAANSSSRRGSSNNNQFLGARTGARTAGNLLHAMHTQFRQPTSSSPGRSPLVSSSRHSGTRRSSSPLIAPSSDPNPGYYIFNGNANNGVFLEPGRRAEDWERIHLPPANHSLNNGEREAEWGLFGRAPSQGR